MDRRVKIALLVAGLAVAGYLGYRWWTNRQNNAGGSPTGSEGTNLNSVAPELIGGSAGPDSGLNYSPQPQNITVNYPSQAITSTSSQAPQPVPTQTNPTNGVTVGTPIITPGNF